MYPDRIVIFRLARYEPAISIKVRSKLWEVSSALSSSVLSAVLSLFSSRSVRNLIYVAAIQITSVLVGRFSNGESGIRSRRFSMCVFRAWTLRLSRSFAILRCLLTPVNRGGRRLVFLLTFLSGLMSLPSSPMLPIFSRYASMVQSALQWCKVSHGMRDINKSKQYST